jgi:hypothetical protein
MSWKEILKEDIKTRCFEEARRKTIELMKEVGWEMMAETFEEGIVPLDSRSLEEEINNMIELNDENSNRFKQILDEWKICG